MTTLTSQTAVTETDSTSNSSPQRADSPGSRLPESPTPVFAWSSGEEYERYIGRWSRMIARRFLDWLAVPTGGKWLDVGCGAGALIDTVRATASPLEVVGVDPSIPYVAHARKHLPNRGVWVEVGDARNLPLPSAAFDAVVAGLVLSDIAEPEEAIVEMRRVARPGGMVAAYVWDFAGEMQMLRRFWDAAIALDPTAAEHDEARRCACCSAERLAALFRAAKLEKVATTALDVPTVFRDFDDFWTPFESDQGPAPRYARSLSDDRRAALREQLRATLPFEDDGSIRLIARAWAARGTR
jgi:SAM-dependent methyltransferase